MALLTMQNVKTHARLLIYLAVNKNEDNVDDDNDNVDDNNDDM